MSRKTEEEIRSEWQKNKYTENPRLIYKWDALNHKPYYSVVLPLLLNNIKSIKNIQKTNRKSDFDISRYSTSSKKNEREEERFCMALYFTPDDGKYPFGKVVNYQVPLKPRKIECKK